jgi:hypothetical protein
LICSAGNSFCRHQGSISMQLHCLCVVSSSLLPDQVSSVLYRLFRL